MRSRRNGSNGGRAPEQDGVVVAVHRHVHAGELGEVVEPAAGCGEVEVEQPDGDLVAVDDVLEADVVVADHRAAFRIGHLAAPRRVGRGHERGADVVQPAHQRRRRREREVGLRPRRVRRVRRRRRRCTRGARARPDRRRSGGWPPRTRPTGGGARRRGSSACAGSTAAARGVPGGPPTRRWPPHRATRPPPPPGGYEGTTQLRSAVVGWGWGTGWPGVGVVRRGGVRMVSRGRPVVARWVCGGGWRGRSLAK